jgi:hypothetical protein
MVSKQREQSPRSGEWPLHKLVRQLGQERNICYWLARGHPLEEKDFTGELSASVITIELLKTYLQRKKDLTSAVDKLENKIDRGYYNLDKIT